MTLATSETPCQFPGFQPWRADLPRLFLCKLCSWEPGFLAVTGRRL